MSGLIIMKSKQTKPNSPQNVNPSTQEEETVPVTGPVYEEVELKNTCGEINCLELAYNSSCIINSQFKQLRALH